MKINKKWFTVIEILTAWAIFILLSVWIISMHSFMLNENYKTLERVKWNLFASYIKDSINKISVPVYTDWQEFYLNYLWDNLNYSTNSFDSEGRVWFFNSDEINDFSHKIKYIGQTDVDWIIVKLYKVDANYGTYSTSYHITK